MRVEKGSGTEVRRTKDGSKAKKSANIIG